MTCNDKSRTVQALDAHGNCESYTFANNRVHGGIEFGGRLGRIIGNDIYGRDAEQTVIGLLATEWKGTEFELRNNRIYTKTTESFDEGGDKRGAIFLHTNEKTVIGGATIVANNAIHVAGDFGQYRGLRAVNNKSTVKWTLIVDNNDFYAETPGYLLSIKKMAGARIAALIIRNNTFRNGAIELAEDAVEELVFRGNWPLPDR